MCALLPVIFLTLIMVPVFTAAVSDPYSATQAPNISVKEEFPGLAAGGPQPGTDDAMTGDQHSQPMAPTQLFNTGQHYYSQEDSNRLFKDFETFSERFHALQDEHRLGLVRDKQALETMIQDKYDDLQAQITSINKAPIPQEERFKAVDRTIADVRRTHVQHNSRVHNLELRVTDLNGRLDCLLQHMKKQEADKSHVTVTNLERLTEHEFKANPMLFPPATQTQNTAPFITTPDASAFFTQIDRTLRPPPPRPSRSNGYYHGSYTAAPGWGGDRTTPGACSLASSFRDSNNRASSLRLH